MDCSLCGNPINNNAKTKMKGNLIVHYLCPKSNPVCGTCWLEHPTGKCDLD